MVPADAVERVASSSPAGPSPAGSGGADRLPWRSTLATGLMAAGGWGCWRFLAGRPELAEALLGAGWHPEAILGLTRISGASPLPVAAAELILVALLVWLVSLPVRAVREARAARASRADVTEVTARGGRRWARAESRAASRPASRAGLRAGLRLVRGIAVLVATFYLLWGWQYARPGLDARLGIPPAGLVGDAELRVLGEALVNRANRLYLEVHGVEDAGSPTPAPAGWRWTEEARVELDAAWDRAIVRWELPPVMARPRPGPRMLRTTPLVRRLGITGVFAPWTGEALLMADLPGAGAHFTAGHESAHQRGIARESDANAMAYLLALESTSAESRYAAALFLQRQVLAALARRDPETTFSLVQGRLPGVQRDVEALAAWARSVAGPTQDMARQANDAMLRRHGIADGVASYGGSLWIVVALARDHGLDALLPPASGLAGPALP